MLSILPEVLERLKANDPEAWNQAYQPMWNWACLHARVGALSYEDVEDSAGNAILKLIKRFKSGFSTFSPDSFNDLASFVKKLHQPTDALSRYLHDALNENNHLLISLYKSGNPVEFDLQCLLMEDLNTILENTRIEDPELLKGINLRPETKRLLETDDTHINVPLLNRMVLEDAYPKEISKYREPILSSEHLSKLLARMARSEAITLIRKYYAIKYGSGQISSLDEIIARLGDAGIGSGGSTSNHDLDRWVRAELLYMALQKLEKGCRDLLMAIYIDGKTYKELAKETGIAEGTLRKRAYDCRQKLLAIYEKLRKQKYGEGR